MESGQYGFLEQMVGLKVSPRGAGVEISLGGGITPNEILQLATSHGTVVEYSLGEPSLREIYLEKVGGADA